MKKSGELAREAYEFEGKLPLKQAIPLGLQHVLAMFVGNLTPLLIITGVCGIGSASEYADIQVALLQNAMIIAGVVTLIQLFAIGPVGGKVPIIMGTSSGFIGVFNSVAKLMGGGVLAYGGISGFVIIFSMYPIVLGLFKEADITRRLIPATIMTGAFTFAMSAMPGTPTIQNLIPTEYFGTTATAAPVIGIVCTIIMFVGPVLWLSWRAKKFRAAGEGYDEPDEMPEEVPDDKLPPAWCCFIPFVVIVILLNVFKMNIVVCLLAGILLSLVFLFLMGKVRGSVYLTNVGETCNKGCQSAVSAIMNTAAAVGFGSVVKITPGFAFLSELVLGIGGSPLIAESIAINVLAGATGSASGGLQIALDALADNFIQMSQTSGIPLAVFHRVGSIACGGLNTMPHDGAVVTYLSYCKISHKRGYFDMFIVAGAIPILANIVAIILGTIGIV